MVEREMAGGEAHYYQFTLEAGQYLQIVLEQRGVEVVTSLFTSGGEKIIEADNPGHESLSVIATQTTSYRVEVRARHQKAETGRYLIRIAQQHVATPADQDRTTAENLVYDAKRLSSKATKENLRQAVEKYRAALPLWRSLQDRREEARTQYLLGLRLQSLGENQEALGAYLQSLNLSRAEGDQGRECLTLSALGTLYFRLGDKGKALDCYNQALALSQIISDRATETSTLINLGVIYKARGDNARALDSYQRALQNARALGDQRIEVAALTNLARLYDLTGDKRTALDAYQKALPVWRALGGGDGEATTLKNMGALFEADGRFKEALEHYGQALALSEETGDSTREAHIRADLARIYSKEGDLGQSQSQIEKALAIFESLRNQLINPELRASFAITSRRYYDFYIDLLMRRHQLRSSVGYDAEAFRISESARARALSDLIAEARIDIRQGVDAALLERERELARMLTARKAERTALIKKKASAYEIESLSRDLLALNAEYEQAQTAIKQASPRYAALLRPSPLSLAEVQRQLLDQETILLEYALGEERSYLWVLTHDSTRSFVLPCREDIERQARDFYDLMTARGDTVKFETPEQKQARVAEADRKLNDVAVALSRALLAPAADLLGQKRLLIVADGILNYVPFGALPNPQPARAEDRANGGGRPPIRLDPLVVNHEVVNLPSASALAELRRESPARRSATSDLAVVADPVFNRADERLAINLTKSEQAKFGQNGSRPQSANQLSFVASLEATFRQGAERDAQDLSRLPYSRQEAMRIAKLAPEGRKLLALDFQANRSLVTGAALGQYRFIHFATHGLLNSESPELSGLIFSLVDEEGRPQPGVLRLSEIYNLKLAADLVTLSACQTGLGKEIKGEGVIGLTRGFMYAGVPRVVASLWSVDDMATAELMTRFYSRLLVRNQTPSAALRAAQVSLLKDKKWKSPYYWAAFTLQGEPK
jgi:CHAT domain-containing protein/tetratricopeptide (TPR) repeat protein